MNELLKLLAENALLLVAGTTVLLALGCGAVMLCKSPVHRQRISELTVAGVLGWMVLALFPLPRLLPEHFFPAKPQAAAPELLGALETTDPLPARIHGTEPIPLPAMTQWVIEDASIQENDSQPHVGRPFQAVPDGPEGPYYFASPSEEFARQSAASTAPIPSAWKFDRTQLAGLFTGAYLAGAALCLLWIITGHVLLMRIRQSAELPPEWLSKQYRILAKQSGIAAPQLIVSHLCTRPLTWGVLWPIVVLPRSLCRQENKSQLETILLHELGHIAQQDSQGNLLFCAALPLLYAHPLFWWLRRESQLAAELVADDWAAWQTGKETYVEELVALARYTGTSSLPLVGVTGLFSSPSQFYRRMHMLLAREKPLSTKTSIRWRLASLSALAGAVVFAASLVGVRPAAGQTEPPAAAPAADEPAVAPAPVPLPATPAPPGLDTPPVAAPPGVTPPVTVLAPPAIRLPEIKDSPSDADEAALLAEIKQLQDKLRALEAKRGAKFYPVPMGAAANAGGNRIAISRADGEGKIWTEIWTTDENGQPSKIISKTAVPARLAVSPDVKVILKEIVDKDGSPRRYILDAATGKVIESVPAPGKGGPTIEPRTTPPAADPNVLQNPAASRTTAARRSELRFPTPIMPGAKAAQPRYDYGFPAAQSAADPNMSRGGQQLDLVSLAISYADAVGVLEAAEAKVKEVSDLNERKAISQQEVTAAKLALSAAQRKEQLLRSIADVATASAAQEYERTSQLHKSGATTGSAANEAQTRMEILKQILRTRPAESEPKK